MASTVIQETDILDDDEDDYEQEEETVVREAELLQNGQLPGQSSFICHEMGLSRVIYFLI
jgi:hypothetical protein